MPKKLDLTGVRFGRLVANRTVGRKRGCYVWECVCDCGNIVHVEVRKLRNGSTSSCGCLRIDTVRNRSSSHRLHHTRLYRIWGSMKTRCFNKNAPNFSFYGGKGIGICEEWIHDFQAFYDWAMGNGYEDGLTIDRIDSDKDYSPQNCQWITQSQNATRANIKRWGDSACKK